VGYDKYSNTLLGKYPPPAILVNASLLNTCFTRDLRGLLNYNGIIFSDGGGYSKESRYRRQDSLIALQLKLDVDIVTTLDYPIHLSRTWAKRKRIRHSIDNALSAAKSLRNRGGLLLYASVHGPSSTEVINATRYLARHSIFDGYALGSLISVKSDYKKIIDLVIAARRAVKKRPLHVYGIVGSATYLLLFYLGVDSVDSQGSLLSGGTRHYYVPGRTDVQFQKLKETGRLPCSCQICRDRTVNDLEVREKIALHNLLTVQREVSEVRKHIEERTYGEYLKTRFDQNPILKKAFEYAERKVQRIL